MGTTKRWAGSAWTDLTTVKRWNGSSWVNVGFIKRWTGSAWTLVWSSLTATITGSSTLTYSYNSNTKLYRGSDALTCNPAGDDGTYTYSWSITSDPSGQCNILNPTSQTATLQYTSTSQWDVNVTVKCVVTGGTGTQVAPTFTVHVL